MHNSQQNLSKSREIHSPAVTDMMNNQALKLLYDKRLLSTLNKAISDTAKSCFNYIHAHNDAENDALTSLERFSSDFIDVLASIINQTKSNYIRHKFGVSKMGYTPMRSIFVSNSHAKIDLQSPKSPSHQTFDVTSSVNKMNTSRALLESYTKTPGSKKGKKNVFRKSRNSVRK